MLKSNYIMACDERGTTRWPSSTKTWGFGGFIIAADKQDFLNSIWIDIKLELCGNADVELKWSHFFEGKHQFRSENPLLSKKPEEWRSQAKKALSKLFANSIVTPITLYVSKNKVSDDAFKITKNGIKVLDTDVLWVGILGQFANFLDAHDATGEVWIDQLGSRKEEEYKQNSWLSLRENNDHKNKLQRIKPKLNFSESKHQSVIQIADFISGVIWAAGEDDLEFIREFKKEYIKQGKRPYRTIEIL